MLAWSTTGAYLAIGTAAGQVSVHAARDGSLLRQLDAHAGGVLAMAWQPQADCLITAGEDGAVWIWEMMTGEMTPVVPEGSPWTEGVAWHPQGRVVATTAGRQVHLWRADGHPVASSHPLASTLSGLQWAPDGSQVATAGYGGVRLFDPETGMQQRHLDWPGAMLNLAWSPNGQVIACGCQDHTLHFWYLADGQDAMMSGFPNKPKAISWSYDSQYLVTTGATTVIIWPFDGKGPEGRAPLQLQGHRLPLTDVAFAPIMPWLATGDKAGVVSLWTPGQRDKPVWRVRLRGPVAQLAWGVWQHQPNLLLAAADITGHVQVWPLG